MNKTSGERELGIGKEKAAGRSMGGEAGSSACTSVTLGRVVRKGPEVHQSLSLDITCPEGMPAITEDEYFESERRKGQP